MAGNCVIGKRGAACVGVHNFSVRNKPQLDKRLKSVADTADQAITAVEQLGYAILYCRVSEKGGDKFAAAVRLICSGKAAGDKDYLCGSQLIRKTVYTASYAVG